MDELREMTIGGRAAVGVTWRRVPGGWSTGGGRQTHTREQMLDLWAVERVYLLVGRGMPLLPAMRYW